MKEMQPRPQRGPKENQIRHAENVSIFHGGFYRGVYYDRGIPRNGKDKVLPQKGVVFNAK